MNSSVPSEMLPTCDLGSPAQEAFSLLSNCSNADWNLLLQDGQPIVVPTESQIGGGYTVPIDTAWNGASNSTSTAGCAPLYNQPHSAAPSAPYVSQTPHHQMMPQYSVDNQNRKYMSSIDPHQPEDSRLNVVNDPRQCSWNYQGSNIGYHHSQQFVPHSDLDSGKSQFFCDIDSRYDLPKLSDFNPETNMINLTGSVTSDILKVVDSDDEESDIIVEDSDTESEISVTVIDDDPPIGSSSDLSCIVCDVSCKDVAAVNFVHINSTFPLTFVSKTPVVMKLIEFIPFDLQNFVKFENTLICRRCLNLIDTAENLEYRLTNIKQELCNFISKSKPFNRGDLIAPESPPVQSRLPCQYQQHQVTSYTTTTTSMPSLTQSAARGEDDNHSESSEIDIEGSKTENHLPPPAFETNSINTVKENDMPQKQNELKDEGPAQQENAKLESDKNKIKEHHQCDRCGRTYLNKNKFSAHMAKHNKNYMFKCQHCFKGFSLEPFLMIHLRMHKDVRKFQCPDCPASFIQESDFKLHSCSESEKRFMCNECPVAFKQKEKLEEHTATSHQKAKHVCEKCSKEFKNLSSLTTHMKSHTNDREFRCEQCQACYKSLSHLNRHTINSHNPEKKNEANSKNHEKVENAFECSECGKHFADKRYLKQHKNIHEGKAKLNTCPICNKTFRISLKTHMTSHSTKKMFKCDVCGSEFAYKQGLMKHVKLKHKKKDV